MSSVLYSVVVSGFSAVGNVILMCRIGYVLACYISSLGNCCMAYLTAFLNHNSSDETQTGHVLGPPDGRTSTHPERKLSPIACCIIRVLMHSALLWASCNNHVCVYNCERVCTMSMLC